MSLEHGEQRQCEGCESRIVGAVQAEGPVTRKDPNAERKVAPITAMPDANGNVLLWRDSDNGLPYYAIIAHEKTREYLHALGVPLRLNHFADCSAAEKFQRKGTG
jgi:hypothetical protein